MNKVRQLLLLITMTFSITTLFGAIGCMDNSQYLKQMYDTKAYHYVSCDCVCRSKGPGTNRCARCGHLMVPQEEEYVTSADAIPQTPGNGYEGHRNNDLAIFMKDPAKKLQQMILEYRNK